MYIARFKEGNLLQRRNKVYYLYKNCNDETLFYVYEKVRQKVIMSSPIFIFCYFWESFDTLFFEQKSKYIYYTGYYRKKNRVNSDRIFYLEFPEYSW